MGVWRRVRKSWERRSRKMLTVNCGDGGEDEGEVRQDREGNIII